MRRKVLREVTCGERQVLLGAEGIIVLVDCCHHGGCLAFSFLKKDKMALKASLSEEADSALLLAERLWLR